MVIKSAEGQSLGVGGGGEEEDMLGFSVGCQNNNPCNDERVKKYGVDAYGFAFSVKNLLINIFLVINANLINLI